MKIYMIKLLIYIQGNLFKFYMHYKIHVTHNYSFIQIKFSCNLVLSNFSININIYDMYEGKITY